MQPAGAEANWNYWKGAKYYQEELRRRALGELPEMESAKCVAEYVAAVFQPGDNLLDAGCGAGHYLLSLRKALRGDFAYTGIDLTAQHIADARAVFAGWPKVSFEVGDVRRLPFPDRAFALTVCANTLPHIPQAAAALRELARVTRRYLFVRTLIGNEILITKKAYSNQLDDQGEPVEFGYVNIYTAEFIVQASGVPAGKAAFLPDKYDAAALGRHYERHRQAAGDHRATRVVDGLQFKGYLLLPWKIARLDLR
jgi:SAM-dependent methyltransferase